MVPENLKVKPIEEKKTESKLPQQVQKKGNGSI